MTIAFATIKRHFFGRNSLWALVPLVVALLASAYINIAYNKTVRATRELVNHSLTVNNAIFELLSALQDVETGQRGFLITADRAYLEPFDKGTAKVEPLIARLQGLVRDNRVQTAQVAAISTLARQKVSETAQTVRVRQEQGFDKARLIVAGNEGKRTMDDVRVAVAEMRQTEQTLLSSRIDAMNDADRNLIYVAAASVLLALLGRMLALLIQLRQRKQRRSRNR